MNWNTRYATSKRPNLNGSDAYKIIIDRAKGSPLRTGDTSQPIVGFTGESGSIYRRLPRTVTLGNLWTPNDEWPQWDRVKSQEQQIMHEVSLGIEGVQPRYMKPQDLTLWVHPDALKYYPTLVHAEDGLHGINNRTGYHDLLMHGDAWSHMPVHGWKTHEFKIYHSENGTPVGIQNHKGHAPVTIHHGRLPQGSNDLFNKYQGNDLIWQIGL